MGDSEQKIEPKPKKSFREFLESTPPDVQEEIENLFQRRPTGWESTEPDIMMYCPSDQCDGDRCFAHKEGVIYTADDNWKCGFLRYTCRNCRKSQKIFGVVAKRLPGEGDGLATKLGELPAFGPHTPARVITLIGPDRELFLKGRRSEIHGLGIGAFSYYRRVVENQKGRILEEIRRVAERLKAPPETLKALDAAIKETQFSRAVDDVKAAIPQVLLIDGQNPLTLLHKALSSGLHAKTDEECLELAQDIRVVLTELAERASVALKDEAQLTGAVRRLAKL
jgi:hypothetical protein